MGWGEGNPRSTDVQTVEKLARCAAEAHHYGASQVLVFGSTVWKENPNDLDLAVDTIFPWVNIPNLILHLESITNTSVDFIILSQVSPEFRRFICTFGQEITPTLTNFGKNMYTCAQLQEEYNLHYQRVSSEQHRCIGKDTAESILEAFMLEFKFWIKKFGWDEPSGQFHFKNSIDLFSGIVANDILTALHLVRTARNREKYETLRSDGDTYRSRDYHVLLKQFRQSCMARTKELITNGSFPPQAPACIPQPSRDQQLAEHRANTAEKAVSVLQQQKAAAERTANRLQQQKAAAERTANRLQQQKAAAERRAEEAIRIGKQKEETLRAEIERLRNALSQQHRVEGGKKEKEEEQKKEKGKGKGKEKGEEQPMVEPEDERVAQTGEEEGIDVAAPSPSSSTATTSNIPISATVNGTQQKKKKKNKKKKKKKNKNKTKNSNGERNSQQQSNSKRAVVSPYSESTNTLLTDLKNNEELWTMLMSLDRNTLSLLGKGIFTVGLKHEHVGLLKRQPSDLLKRMRSDPTIWDALATCSANNGRSSHN